MLSFLLMYCLGGSAHAQTAQTKKLNTQLYEQESSAEKTQSISAKVRVVRDISDDVEVFFESEKATGAYTLPRNSANYATMLKKLEDSRKSDGPAVTVVVDSEKRIKSVETSQAPVKKTKNMYDPGDIPDI